MQNYIVTVARTAVIKLAVCAENPQEAEVKCLIQGGYEMDAPHSLGEVVLEVVAEDQDGGVPDRPLLPKV